MDPRLEDYLTSPDDATSAIEKIMPANYKAIGYQMMEIPTPFGHRKFMRLACQDTSKTERPYCVLRVEYYGSYST